MERQDRAWVAPEAGSDAPPSGVQTGAALRDAPTTTIAPPAPVGPMTLGDVLDGAFTIVKRRPRAVIGAVAIVVVPVQVVAVWLQRGEVSDTVSQSPYDVLVDLGSGASVPVTVFVAALASLSLFFVGGVVATFVSGWYAGKEVTGGDALRASFRRTGAFLAAWALLLPVKAMSYVLCVLPLAVTVTFFALVAPAIVIEGLGPLQGIRRSAQLVARRFWPTLGIVMLATLVENVLQTALSAIPLIVAALVPAPANWIVLAAGNAAAALVTTTALVGVSVLLYFDLRARTEGLDLDIRAADAFGRAS